MLIAVNIDRDFTQLLMLILTDSIKAARKSLLNIKYFLIYNILQEK